MRLKTTTLFIAAFLATAPSQAIVIRHDRDSAQYQELAVGFPMVCQIGGGVGTLIAPEWVVTAAHVADQNVSEVSFGDRVVPVAETFMHPDYALPGKHRDIALLKLTEPVNDITPAVMHSSADELGMTVLFVGNGRTGDGKTGPHPGERVMRGAHNVVSEVEPGWVNFIFDAPPAGLDLEGISGPGDSGGPALVKVDEKWHVIGVSAFNDGGELCTYGTTEHYGRVSDERVWLDGIIDGSIGNNETPIVTRHVVNDDGVDTVVRVETTTVKPAEGVVQATTAVAVALTQALNQEDLAAFRATMSASYLDREGAASIKSLFDFVGEGRAAHGDIATMHPVQEKALAVSDTEAPMMIALWHYKDGLAGYFGITLNNEGLIDEFSLFVRRDLCREGKECKVAEELR